MFSMHGLRLFEGTLLISKEILARQHYKFVVLKPYKLYDIATNAWNTPRNEENPAKNYNFKVTPATF